jgi:hypothetical protein
MGAASRPELLVFALDDGAGRLEGGIVAALERAESGGAIRVVETLFAMRDADSGEVSAVRFHGGSGGLVATLTDFRLAPERRREIIAGARGGGRAAVPADVADDLGGSLAPGGAIVAVLVEHEWLAGVRRAADRIGGRMVADELLAEGEADIVSAVLAAVARPS